MSESNYITATKEAMNNAYVPYSNYPVGALIVTKNGNTYSGCNVENVCCAQNIVTDKGQSTSQMLGNGIKHLILTTNMLNSRE